MRRRLVLLVLLLGGLPSTGIAAGAGGKRPQAPSQQPVRPASSDRRTLAAIRLKDGESIDLDGRFDEAAWLRAEPASDFRQQDPNNGQPATERTEVRIVYDANALYIGVTCFDSEPDRWLGYQRRRDQPLDADDRFMWTIDTYLDARTAYYFEMNPSGAMGDALQGVGGISNRQWDGIWDGRVQHNDAGWSLEIRIPFRTLNFNPGTDTWGINFQRTVRRKNEESLWSGWPRNQGLLRMTNAGLLTQLSEVSQGTGIDLKPYAVFTSQSSPGRDDDRVRNKGNAGFDVFYNPTPGLRANLTVNTDFAQTEVDQRQVNLTRFPLFFPEKRDFFLDGSTFLDFGAEFTYPGEWTPYFSRRIGLGDDALPQKINYGAKLTGQSGNFDVGVLQVQTANTDGLIGEDFTVARVRRRLLRQSYVGGFYTRRAAREGTAPDLYTLGADFVLATSTLFGSQNLSLEGFYLNTTNPLDTGDSRAYGARLNFPNDPWLLALNYSEVQQNYNAAVGYTPRVGFRRLGPQFTYSKRPRQHPYVRRLAFGSSLNWLVDPASGETLNREWTLTVLQTDFHSGDTIRFNVLPYYELLDEPFRITPGVTLPAGNSYTYTRYSVRASTASRRVVAVTPTYEWGEFYSGDRRRFALDLNLRARPGLIFYLSSEWNQVNLAEGKFKTRLYRAIGEAQFNPRMSVVNNVQYDTQSAVLGWQSRFRWIVTPGDDVYVVYTHNWLDDPLDRRFRTLDHRLASKVLYTHRF